MIFTEEELQQIDKNNIPTHIAIIPDGNRRWAKTQTLPWTQGHVAGVSTVVTIVKAAKALGIKTLSLFSFSTENWKKRPKNELDHLIQVITESLYTYQEELLCHRIRLRVIGDLEELPMTLCKILKKTVSLTADCEEFDLVLAINYGGRDEICRAVKKMMKDLLDKKISIEDCSEERFPLYLDTHGLPDPDLLIRTSGEKRISNFLLWQSSYSEVFIDEVAWPEFTPQHLLKAICDFQGRERRKGGGEAVQ